MVSEDRGGRIDGQRDAGSSPIRLLLLLGALLLACVVPCLVRLGARDSTHTMENVAVVVSQETWLRWHAGEPYAWLVTTNDSLPRIRKPPMLTWINFLAWSGLDPGTASPVELLYRARLASVGLGLLMLTAIFWLGMTLGDSRMAILSLLVGGSIFFLQRQMRTASYDVHFVAWASLAAASAVWAMQLRAASVVRWKAAFGWGLAGLLMAVSTMTKNPLAIVLVIVPVATAVILIPHRRRTSLIGLAAAVGLALALVTPWYAYVAATYEDVVASLTLEFRAARADPQPPYYYVALLALVMPWTPWLLAGLVHPFMPTTRDCRRWRLVPWLWFILIFVLFSIPGAKQQRYILPIIPAAALLMGQVWSDHERLARRGERDDSARLLVGAHWIILLLGSLAIGPVLAMRRPLARVMDWAPIPWPAAAVWTVLLCGLVWWGWRQHQRWRPMVAGITSVVWTLLVLGLFWYAYGTAPSGTHPIRVSAETFALRVAGAPVRSLRITEVDRTTDIVNEEFRFYFGRRILHTTPETLGDDLAAVDGPLYVLARDEPAYGTLLGSYELSDEGLVHVDRDQYFRLWRKQGSGAEAVAAPGPDRTETRR
jgi:4-amino-4-deoxy-L-arabinose transferase-like glycosyltransferase